MIRIFYKIIIAFISMIVINCSEPTSENKTHEDNFTAANPGQIITGANLVIYDIICNENTKVVNQVFDCLIRYLIDKETIAYSSSLNNNLKSTAKSKSQALENFLLLGTSGGKMTPQPANIKVDFTDTDFKVQTTLDQNFTFSETSQYIIEVDDPDKDKGEENLYISSNVVRSNKFKIAILSIEP